MHKTWKDFLPPVEALLEMEPEAIAPSLLMYLNDFIKGDNQRNMIHISHHVSESSSTLRDYAGGHIQQVMFVLAEAWGWLVDQNFLCPQPGDTNNGWLFISRRGKTIQSPDDFKKFSHIGLLPRSVLDSELDKKVWPSFIDGDFDTAIFAAFKEVEIRMRNAAGLDDTHYGTSLARDVFHVDNGSLTDTSHPDRGERQAYSDLFAGAIGVFKSPGDHRVVNYDDPVTAVSIILFANTLLKIIDKRKPA